MVDPPKWHRVDSPLVLAGDRFDRGVVLDAALRAVERDWNVPRSRLTYWWFWSGGDGEAELFAPNSGYMPPWATALSVIVVLAP